MRELRKIRKFRQLRHVRRARALPLVGEVMRLPFAGTGMLTYSPSIVAASVKVLEKSATPDMQVTFAPGSFKGGQIGELEEKPGLSAGAWQMRPLSRGYVEAKSNRLANHAGNQPALPLGGTRPARHHRRSAAGAAIFAVPRCSRSSGTARHRRGGIWCSGAGPSTIAQSVDRSNHSAQF
jgi:hypothetical protein